MKSVMVLLCIFAIGMDSAVADDAADVKKREIELWEAWHHLDVKKWSELTSPDYTWTRKQTRNYLTVRKEFDMGHLDDYKTTEMQAIRVSADVIILSYRASIQGVYNNKPLHSDVAECSVRAKQGGKWRSVILHEVEASEKETQLTPP